MSYIVNKITIDRILSSFDDYNIADLLKILVDKKHKINNASFDDKLSFIGNKMWELNHKNLEQKFISKYVFEKQSVDIIQAIASLSCFIYNCDTGCFTGIKQTSLQIELEKIRNNWCYSVVSNLPEWNKVCWG